MKILLVNPPYLTLTSRMGVGHQIPLGLLMVGGPLLDAGHQVKLLDAERRHLPIRAIIEEVDRFSPDMVMTGHAGSTPAHPTCVRMLRAIKRAFPQVVTVYGGVYPTFHAEEILQQEGGVDVIVRGEGEAVSLELVKAIESRRPLHTVKGLAYRAEGHVELTPAREPIQDLDAFPIGWDLIWDWDDYQCFGLGKAAVSQFSRGCPHACTFCGQQEFWQEWRHRDPVKVADEIEWLHRTHGVRFISLADENPTTDRAVWHHFLEELAARDIGVHFFISIRTPDIVRDADILHLYKKAGIQYILLGVESVDPQVLKDIKKGSTTQQDLVACRLLKQHGIFSIVAHVVGLQEESWKTFRAAIKQLAYYNGDFVNVTHVTPHSWTEFARQTQDRPIIQPDVGKWDYRHQILLQPRLSPWKVFLGAKLIEACVHARPGKLWSILRTRDRFLRKQLIWCFFHTTAVYWAEVILWKATKSHQKHPYVPIPKLRSLRPWEGLGPKLKKLVSTALMLNFFSKNSSH
jgi:anaerobic magnesium-protoporphyrin IX monomethyl ester cyclase